MIYVMSDIHGMYEKYIEMLELIHFTDDDILYVLGDIVDRGNDSIKILQDMMLRDNVYPLIGNHEYMAISCLKWINQQITEDFLESIDEDKLLSLTEWLNNGGYSTIQEFKELSIEEKNDIIDYLYEFSAYEELSYKGKEYVFVHAGISGFDKDKPLDEYDIHDFIWERIDYEQPYYEDKYVIAGHTPTPLICGQPKIYHHNHFINIDCGACFQGGKLACLCLDTFEEFYV